MSEGFAFQTGSKRDKRALIALGLAAGALIVSERVQANKAGPTAQKIASVVKPSVLAIGGTALAVYGAFKLGTKTGIAAVAALGVLGYVNRSRIEHGKAPLPLPLPGLTVDLAGHYQALPRPLSGPLAFDFKGVKTAA